MTKPVFPKFIETQWSTMGDKQKFAKKFISFVERGFPETAFSKPFYNRLSNCFGFIAHYDAHGFYNTYFVTHERQLDFINRIINHTIYGDPAYTYSDVEKFLQTWMKTRYDKYLFEAKQVDWIN